ncbi:N-formylglutamate amidohydrolase [Myxococcota bacterium]|nr:N-formylglutamate amidohydrolase [Myxococcota bacterium]
MALLTSDENDGSTRVSGDPHAYEVFGRPKAGDPFILLCEHATRLAPDWDVSEVDEKILQTHWGYDLGADDLTRLVASQTECPAVLSRFSRLVCDPNRDPEEPSFILDSIEGQPLSFNQDLSEQERRRRRERYFDAYHDAVDCTVSDRAALDRLFCILSIHSFTPVYQGERRSVEVGVLFDRDEGQAIALAERIEGEGFRTALNAPYSGYDGLIYSARRHGRAHRVSYFELEVRQDLLEEASGREALAGAICRALGSWSEFRQG